MKNNRLFAIVVLAALSMGAHAGLHKEIKFPKGKSSAELTGGIVRGESDEFTFVANAGQFLSLRITSEENNGVFQVYEPGYHRDAEGIIIGTQLDETGDLVALTRRLPVKGAYLIVVGGTRGNTSYKLGIAIEDAQPASYPVTTQLSPDGAIADKKK